MSKFNSIIPYDDMMIVSVFRSQESLKTFSKFCFKNFYMFLGAANRRAEAPHGIMSQGLN